MQKVNIKDISELEWTSPKGKYRGFGKQISEALGRERDSLDINKRQPFDVEMLRAAPGQTPYIYHSHSAQWEFYYIVSGTGSVRDERGTTQVQSGDAFIFKPGEAHQLVNDGTEDLLVFVVADNPVGESCYHPDSGKWAVHSPDTRLIRSEALDYYDGEE